MERDINMTRKKGNPDYNLNSIIYTFKMLSGTIRRPI